MTFNSIPISFSRTGLELHPNFASIHLSYLILSHPISFISFLHLIPVFAENVGINRRKRTIMVSLLHFRLNGCNYSYLLFSKAEAILLLYLAWSEGVLVSLEVH